MPAEVSVTTDPLIVYGMVGLLVGALLLALLFSRPRHGLGTVKHSELPERASTDEPWMPTGDVFAHDPEPVAALPAAAATDATPILHDPWSNGTKDSTIAPPPWGQR
jgi:hypothetical protein